MGISVTGGVKFPQGKFSVYVAPAGPAGNELWTWGNGGSGRLGLGNTTNYSSPVQIGALIDWASVEAGGSASFAVKTDGTLWSWGYNIEGLLGQGDVVLRSSPVQVGSLTNWTQCSSDMDAYGHTLALKTNGELWAWGRGFNFGQLGQGITINQSSPVQIGSLTNWASVTVGTGGSRAIKTDGTLWSWGANNNGTLGLGDVINRSSPVQVGLLTDWASVDSGTNHSIAIKTDGTLWSWGFGGSGRLGDGTTVSKSSPVPIGALTDWVNVSAGFQHNLAVKTDGTLWAWGDNAPTGDLGDGTVVDRSSPVQIGLLSDWVSVNAGRNLSLARKTNGTIWAWGFNNTGQVGDGTVISRSSPVQIGSLTDWNSISLRGYHPLVLKTP